MLTFKPCVLPFLLCIIFQSPVRAFATSQVQEEITEAESQRVRDVAREFGKRFEETEDLAPLLKELFVSNFTERYVKEQRKQLGSERSPGSAILFAPGLEYWPSLLDQTSAEDWRRFYVAAYNFLLHGMLSGYNRSAESLLSGKTPKEKILKEIYPEKASELLNAHPILKNFILMKERRPIATVEEMRDVTATLEQAMRLIREAQGNQPVTLTAEAKKVMQMMNQVSDFGPSVSVIDEDYFGYPPGTRVFHVVSPLMLQLEIVQVNSDYRIVWAEPAGI
jgi:hypothetical protein